jgi:hypothetical protein
MRSVTFIPISFAVAAALTTFSEISKRGQVRLGRHPSFRVPAHRAKKLR